MDPLGVANEVTVKANEALIISVSRRLVVALVLMVFAGVGVLTVNVYLVKQQVEHLTTDMTVLSTTVVSNSKKLTELELSCYESLSDRVERLERQIDHEGRQ